MTTARTRCQPGLGSNKYGTLNLEWHVGRPPIVVPATHYCCSATRVAVRVRGIAESVVYEVVVEALAAVFTFAAFVCSCHLGPSGITDPSSPAWPRAL